MLTSKTLPLNRKREAIPVQHIKQYFPLYISNPQPSPTTNKEKNSSQPQHPEIQISPLTQLISHSSNLPTKPLFTLLRPPNPYFPDEKPSLPPILYLHQKFLPPTETTPRDLSLYILLVLCLSISCVLENFFTVYTKFTVLGFLRVVDLAPSNRMGLLETGRLSNLESRRKPGRGEKC